MTDIEDTGTRGFLKWLQAAQPGIYARIAAELPRKAPQLFTDFEAGGGNAGAEVRRLSGLGDTLQPIDLSAVDAGSIPQVDVADAANSTATDTGTANWLSSLINGVSSAYLTVNQAQQNDAIIQAQLQRAKDGLPPLSINPQASGVPIISAGGLGGSGSVWLIGGVVAALGLLASAASSRR